MDLDYFVLSLIVVNVVIIILGFPVAYALAVCALTFILVEPVPLSMAVHKAAFSVNHFTMLAIPLFMFAGKLMVEGRIADRIFDFAHAVVGRVPGGLGHVNVLSSLVFAGMSGSVLADVAGLGQIEYKAMTKKGYDPDFTIGVTLASSAIGPILPPSVAMVLFGVAADVSILGLFLGGVLPGFLIAACLMVYVYFVGRRRGYYESSWVGWRPLGRATLHALLPLLTPVIIVGGMTLGIFSPTEAATVSVLYALFISWVVYRDMTLAKFLHTLRAVVVDVSRLLYIIAFALLFGWVIIVGQVPQQIAYIIGQTISSPTIFFLVVMIMMLILGAVIENAILILILAPMLTPIAVEQYGIDPIHFGVCMVFNTMIAHYTPPVGLCLFVMRDITGLSLGRVSMAVLPFMVPLLISLLIMAYVPWVVLAVPRAFGL